MVNIHTEFNCPYDKRIRDLEENRTQINERIPEDFAKDWALVKNTVLGGNGISKRMQQIESKVPYIVVIAILVGWLGGGYFGPIVGRLLASITP